MNFCFVFLIHFEFQVPEKKERHDINTKFSFFFLFNFPSGCGFSVFLFLFLDRICFVFIRGECGWKRNDTIWGPHRDAHKHLLFYYYYIRLEDFEKKLDTLGSGGCGVENEFPCLLLHLFCVVRVKCVCGRCARAQWKERVVDSKGGGE